MNKEYINTSNLSESHRRNQVKNKMTSFKSIKRVAHVPSPAKLKLPRVTVHQGYFNGAVLNGGVVAMYKKAPAEKKVFPLTNYYNNVNKEELTLNKSPEVTLTMVNKEVPLQKNDACWHCTEPVRTHIVHLKGKDIQDYEFVCGADVAKGQPGPKFDSNRLAVYKTLDWKDGDTIKIVRPRGRTTCHAVHQGIYKAGVLHGGYAAVTEKNYEKEMYGNVMDFVHHVAQHGYKEKKITKVGTTLRTFDAPKSIGVVNQGVVVTPEGNIVLHGGHVAETKQKSTKGTSGVDVDSIRREFMYTFQIDTLNTEHRAHFFQVMNEFMNELGYTTGTATTAEWRKFYLQENPIDLYDVYLVRNLKSAQVYLQVFGVDSKDYKSVVKFMKTIREHVGDSEKMVDFFKNNDANDAFLDIGVAGLHL
jgi:hypothetical protein